MNQKFNLSEKINDYGYNDDGSPDSDILEVEDVKEFIKQLKKQIEIDCVVNEDDISYFNELIKELTGDLK